MKELSPQAWKLLQALVDRLSESQRVVPVPELADATGLSWYEIVEAFFCLMAEDCIAPHPRGGIRITFRI